MSEPNTFKAPSRGERIGRILNDFHDRRARGEPVSEEELLAAHPDLADDLRPYLEMLGELRSEGDRIKRLVADGVLRESDDPAYQATLGDYRTIGFLGRGGMGIVLKAHEESLNRTVALKILRPELADDKASLQRFTREAKAAAMLRHPNIVTVYSVGEKHGVSYIAMEYIEGPRLADLIHEQAPLPTDIVRRLFREVLLGLAAAHEAGLIHRDIKSANILLDGPEQLAKIADFGLARMAASQTRITLPESTPGTPEYMSPEQARGDEDIDHRADLYSAGVVLYEMLTGRTPFRADTPSAVIHRILHEEPAVPRTVSEQADPHLASLAMRLMAKRPEERFASAGDVIEALDAGEGVTSLAKRRRMRRHVLLWLVALGSVSGAAWFLSRFTARPPIARVWVDNTNKTTILASYGDDPTPRVFLAFRPEIIQVRVSPLLELDGSGRVAFVAALERSFEHHNLFAYGAEGEEMWRRYLSSSGLSWPDCSVSAQWSCSFVLAGDLDGTPGDELVVVASDTDYYPTRISIVDPRKGKIRTTFWHMGHLIGMHIQRDFFGDGHPALIAWAYHNKLDGFDDPLPGDVKPLTNRDVVTVAMVLDPADMEGLGPPLTGQEQLRDLAPARPFAYAFLDAEPPGGWNGPDGPTDGLGYDEPEVAFIRKIEPNWAPTERDGVACMNVQVTHPGEAPGWHLIVDRNLALLKVEATGDRTSHGKLADWDGLWRPIIRHGEYVKE